MNLVYLSEYGIKGINYYWEKKDKFNLSETELLQVGIKGNDAMVDARIIPNLLKANKIFKKSGFEIIVKDAYRSPELYKLVQEKRYINDGKEVTDRTLNLVKMPHATGLAVDVNLIDLKTGKEVEIREINDWPNSIFLNYYKDKTDFKSKEYQRLQDLLVDTMLSVGFKLGDMKEFHHFEYEVKDE